MGRLAVERFENSYEPVTESGCWIWLKCLDRGYGVTSFKGMKWRAHRLFWFLKYGCLEEKICVLHKCDVRCCVNPDHLYLGTQKDNHRDALVRNRKTGRSKLNFDQIKYIREFPRFTGSGNYLAEVFDIAASAISNIRNGKNWAFLFERK